MNGKRHTNPWQLVLRRDMATGLMLVGWSDDLPLGRFEHLSLICETVSAVLPAKDSEQYIFYQAAMETARNSNFKVIEQQSEDNRQRGWYEVPFALIDNISGMPPDDIGSYAAAAIKLQYQLAGHCRQVWATALEGKIIHVRARYPKKELDALTAQVWYFRQLDELQAFSGQLLEGTLVACESGLWLNTDSGYLNENGSA